MISKSIMIKTGAKRGRVSEQFRPLSCIPEPKTSSPIIASAVNVVSNEDLLLQILLDVPLKALTSFKSVTLDFIPEPFSSTAIRVGQSCNGLLLCSSFRAPEKDFMYYVYNPTTKEFATIPQIGLAHLRNVQGMSLAFNPAKSPYYKVVCVRGSKMFREQYQMEIYSSETRLWRVSGQPFTPPVNKSFFESIYWNGSVHWWGSFREPNLWEEETSASYFKVDEEKLEKLPMLKNHHIGTLDLKKLLKSCYEAGKVGYAYLGESGDHLDLVIYTDFFFNIYEMARDYSGWFVKYQVNVPRIPNIFPKIKKRDYYRHTFDIVFLGRRGKVEEEDRSFLVLEIHGEVFRYNLVDKSVERLCESAPTEDSNNKYGLNNVSVSPYIESLACV